jgi:uncharacterized membrane protein
MIVIIGLIALIAAAAVALAGFTTNGGSSHMLGDNFGVFGQHMNNVSTGQLFVYGVVVGVVGMLGLTLLWGAFTRRIASGGMRRELKTTKHEAEIVRQDRDRLNKELEDERNKHPHDVASSGNDTTPVVD